MEQEQWAEQQSNKLQYILTMPHLHRPRGQCASHYELQSFWTVYMHVFHYSYTEQQHIPYEVFTD